MSGNHDGREQRYRRAFGIGIGLNLSFVAVELVAGFAANSLALIADAWHNLSDVAGLLLAWVAFAIAGRQPSQRFTYGLRKATILAALVSSVVLLTALGAIAWEAVQRFAEPRPTDGLAVVGIAAVGVVINAATAWLFHADRHADLNVEGAFLHLAADAVVSLGVVLGGVAVLVTGQVWIDPLLSLLIVAVIAVSSFRLLRDSLQLSLDAAPRALDLARIATWLREQPAVVEHHDLHVWAISTTQVALTVHVTARADAEADALLAGLRRGLHDEFAIEHATVQIETAGGATQADCAQARHC